MRSFQKNHCVAAFLIQLIPTIGIRACTDQAEQEESKQINPVKSKTFVDRQGERSRKPSWIDREKKIRNLSGSSREVEA
ncbi:hypothetical protein Hdeb2414_s0006g00202001 [Helianthus debilis subsp. tardiflorus]